MKKNLMHYHQPCPVCGRSLQIQVLLLGKRVYCQHCGGGFLATDPSMEPPLTDHAQSPLDSVVADLLERADIVLEQSANRNFFLGSYDC
ncbi:MAG: response regulator [Planctomycetia bacterium]|nr:response regulator [Planctomycetia bacterium]